MSLLFSIKNTFLGDFGAPERKKNFLSSFFLFCDEAEKNLCVVIGYFHFSLSLIASFVLLERKRGKRRQLMCRYRDKSFFLPIASSEAVDDDNFFK